MRRHGAAWVAAHTGRLAMRLWAPWSGRAMTAIPLTPELMANGMRRTSLSLSKSVEFHALFTGHTRIDK